MEDLSHAKIMPIAGHPNRGIGNPWANPSNPAQVAKSFVIPQNQGEVKEVAEVAESEPSDESV
jgi:hypothetical protein